MSCFAVFIHNEESSNDDTIHVGSNTIVKEDKSENLQSYSIYGSLHSCPFIKCNSVKRRVVNYPACMHKGLSDQFVCLLSSLSLSSARKSPDDEV